MESSNSGVQDGRRRKRRQVAQWKKYKSSHKHKVHNQWHRRLSWWPQVLERRQPTKTRCDAKFHRVIKALVDTSAFNWCIMITIFFNAITIALETTPLAVTHPLLFDVTDGIFLTIYIAEFLIKVYAEPLDHWRSWYNWFDFFILLVSVLQAILSALEIGHTTGVVLLRVVRALRTLRTLRSISFFKGLQVLVKALIQTFRTAVLHLLLLLLVLMFLFAVMGYYFFGYDSDADKEHWGDFGRAMLSLFAFVTADGWTDLQDSLTSKGYVGSQFFTIVFIFLGHFIFTNLFIGVIITNIHSATEEFRLAQLKEREEFIKEKKAQMIERQHEEVLKLQQKQRDNHFANFKEMLSEFEKTLRHDDFSYTSDICTSPLWMESMLTSLQHMEANRYRCQQLQHELAWCLATMREEEGQGRVDAEPLRH